MNIKNSNKFIPNLLFQNQDSFDQYIPTQSQDKTPFQPIDNTQAKITRNARKKNRHPKYMIKTEGNQLQQNIKVENISFVKSKFKAAEKEVTNPAPTLMKCDIPKKANFIINFQEEDVSDIVEEEDQKKLPIVQQKTTVQQNILFQSTEKLNLIDWSSDNEDNLVSIIQNSTNQLVFPNNFQKIQLKEKKQQKWSFQEEQEKQQTLKNTIQQIPKQKKQMQKAQIKQQKQKKVTVLPSNNDITISKQSIFQQLAEGSTIQCLIRRDKKTIDGILQYNVYLEKSMKHILLIRKQGRWEYCFYLKQQTKNGEFTNIKIASMESTFLNCSFTLLKCNENYSYMTVHYDTNFLGMAGPRKMEIYLPKEIIPFEYLQDCYEEKKWQGKIQKCVNKTAKWNERAKSYVLNFKGRALKSSIKNFVITDKNESDDKSFVIFGKAGPDTFNLDIQKPFSIIQGVALAMSSFQRKILCD